MLPGTQSGGRGGRARSPRGRLRRGKPGAATERFEAMIPSTPAARCSSIRRLDGTRAPSPRPRAADGDEKMGPRQRRRRGPEAVVGSIRVGAGGRELSQTKFRSGSGPGRLTHLQFSLTAMPLAENVAPAAGRGRSSRGSRPVLVQQPAGPPRGRPRPAGDHEDGL